MNATSYYATLDRLLKAFRRKRPGLLSKGALLLHNNARQHTASVTCDLKQRFRWNVLEHPPYSPDFAPSDFNLFGTLKKHLAGRPTWTQISSMPVAIDWFTDGTNVSTTVANPGEGLSGCSPPPELKQILDLI
ncbi:hypothetical protein AVEN_14094-1 [Araneus ventricosus]|uniref:Mariner Mos1 transposase n=1 Tax=Araneus ventricosus TaxID=182803 RepID=A0A4Y2FZA7_ARAVE|nr:hypothetical protein AVEN_14094-1 [Araneus ventricosus]